MEYEESERSGYQDREDEDFAEGVHIRQENRGVMHYAVFDGEEQVSEEAGPLNEEYILAFIEAYSEAKRKYTDAS
mgnify:CR=1 FL=1